MSSPITAPTSPHLAGPDVTGSDANGSDVNRFDGHTRDAHSFGAHTGCAAIRVSKAAARRFLLLRSGLGRHDEGPACCGGGPGEARQTLDPVAAAMTLQVVKALEYVQIDPMRVLECNHHLALGSRVPGYTPGVLDDLLYVRRRLVEVIARNRYVVPVEDYWMFRARFAEIERRNRPRLGQLEAMMSRVLRRIEAEGAMSSLDFDEAETVSGWWDPDGENRTRAVRQALEWLFHFGRLAISHRVGTRRYFDLPERLYGATYAGSSLRDGQGDTAADYTAELDALLRKYFRATGLVDVRDWGFGWARYSAPERRALSERFAAAGELVPVEVEGTATAYYVTAAEADDLVCAGSRPLAPDVRLLPPLDNVIWLRPRLAEVFDFSYTWEAYVPRPRRLYGPYTCPVLYGDRFAGRVDAKVDRDRRALVVNGLWWEPDLPRPPLQQLEAALGAWAAVCGAETIEGLAGKAGPGSCERATS